MAELYDAHGNPIQLTDEFGNPVTLTDERGNPIHLTGIATEPGQDVYELAAAVASGDPTGIPQPGGTGYSTLGGGTHLGTPIAEPCNGTPSARDSATLGSTLGVAPPVVSTGMGTGGKEPLRRSGSSSSSSSEDDGQGGRRRKKKGLKDKIMEKLTGGKKEEEQQQPPPAATTIGGSNTPAATTTTSSAGGEVHQKKSMMEKIKEKLPGHHSHHSHN